MIETSVSYEESDGLKDALRGGFWHRLVESTGNCCIPLQIETLLEFHTPYIQGDDN